MKSRPFVFIGLNILLIVSCLGCGKETGSWRELDNRSLPVSFSGYTKHPNQRVKVLVQDELGNWETIAETTTASVASHHLDVCVSNGRFASQMSPDARRFVSSEFGRSIEIHDSITGGTERSLPAHNGHTYCFAFGSTGRYMVTGGSDNRVRVWDLAITDRRLVMSRSPGARIKALVISPTNIEMAVALSQNSSKKHRIEIRDVASHKIIRELIGHTNWPTCFAYSPEGTKLLSGGLDNTIRVWNPKSGEHLAVLEGHESPLSGVSFLSDSRFAVSMDEAGMAIVWNIENESIERTWNLEATVESVAFHPLRPLIAVACKDIGVSILDAIQGRKLAQLPRTTEFNQVCFSPNGRRLATVGVESSTFIWQTDLLLTGRSASPVCELKGQSDTINNVSFSPDGKRLVSSCRDESVRLFDVECGHELITLESGRGTDGLVHFSPDGRFIVRTIEGIFSTWTIDDVRASKSPSSSQVSDIEWHRSEAAAATKSQNWFAAQFHQDHLTRLAPNTLTHFLDRANSKMFLGDFAGAEKDLHRCDGKTAPETQGKLQTDLARVYLGQGKSIEYGEICKRFYNAYCDSNNPEDLNILLWYCALGSNESIDTLAIRERFENLVANPKHRKAKYMNTLALAYYRERKYRKAIECAKESIRLFSGSPSPSDWMILALSYAQLDQQRIGWLPFWIRSKIREWGFSLEWSTSSEFVRKVDTWMAQQIAPQVANKIVTRESNLLMRTELPLLKREWSEIANSK